MIYDQVMQIYSSKDEVQLLRRRRIRASAYDRRYAVCGTLTCDRLILPPQTYLNESILNLIKIAYTFNRQYGIITR